MTNTTDQHDRPTRENGQQMMGFQKRPTKETYKRDLQKRPTKMTNTIDQHDRPTRENGQQMMGFQKRLTKKTCKKDKHDRPIRDRPPLWIM